MGMAMTRVRRPARNPARGAAAVLLVALALSACGQGDEAPGAAPGSPDEPDGTPTTGTPATQTPSEDGMDPDDQTPTGPSDPTVGPADLPADPSGAELVLVVSSTGDEAGGEQPPVTLSCDFTTGTATGTHPRAEQACTDLQAAVEAGNPFAPVPPDAMCTQQFGGDAVVDVSGAVLAADGGPVDVQARFSLTDGCEISRWEQMGAVLAPYRGDV